MLRKLAISVVTGCSLAIIAASCNDDNNGMLISVTTEYTDTAITTFALDANSKILKNLDSVFFSIDQMNARIFNAESLPKGTRIDSLGITFTYPDKATKVEVTYKMPNQNDTTINYLENASDAVDFSQGPVKIAVTGGDGASKRTYTVDVNVHRMEPDSLYWAIDACHPLPYLLNSEPIAQRTVMMGDRFFCLATPDNALYTLTTGTLPVAIDGSVDSMPFRPVLQSLTATDAALYVLNADTNELYTSTDRGMSWAPTGAKMATIYGAYNDRVIGLDAAQANIISYPAASVTPLPNDFPVSGVNQTLSIELEWMAGPEMFMVGGRNRDGQLLATTWAYDGTEWQQFKKNQLPVALEGVSLVPYYTCSVDSVTWRVTQQAAFMAVGGTDQNGALNANTYLSYNYGLSWFKAGELMQLPDYIAPLTYAQAFVAQSMVMSRSDIEGWIFAPRRPLPAWYQIANVPQSRAVRPITEWECPYIYLFGGYDADGKLKNTVWRGAINRLVFKPIQ